MFLRRCILYVFCIFISQDTLALAFKPTRLEWQIWPDYCRARYVVSNAGRGSEFKREVSAGTVNRWERRLKGAWSGLHHYCAGLVLFERAKMEKSKIRKATLIKRAIKEAMYTYDGTSPKDPMYARIAVFLARLNKELNRDDKSMEYIKQSMNLHPQYDGSYVFLGMLHRKDGHRDKALEVLSNGNEALSGRSAEILYIMGLIYYEKGDFIRAKVHAQQAYRLGYPLPGLKRKLAEVGHWKSP